jgi:hypothetical protein
LPLPLPNSPQVLVLQVLVLLVSPRENLQVLLASLREVPVVSSTINHCVMKLLIRIRLP